MHAVAAYTSTPVKNSLARALALARIQNREDP
jgi:hypothetical protein